jgi:hypothetical protein
MKLVKVIGASIAALGATALISCRDVDRNEEAQVEQPSRSEEIATGPQTEEGALDEPSAGVDETTTGTSATDDLTPEETTTDEPRQDMPPAGQPGEQP